jgi:fructose-1,6-bisphosphatase I
VENAGGKASNGFQRILEIQPNEIHQRVPLFIGSKENVEMVEKFLSGERK